MADDTLTEAPPGFSLYKLINHDWSIWTLYATTIDDDNVPYNVNGQCVQKT